MEWKAIATLIAATIAALTSILSAYRSGKTAKEVTGLKAYFDKELKRHEYRLAYQKVITQKRVDAHDNLILLTSSLFMPESKAQDGHIQENPFNHPDILNDYLVDLFNFTPNIHWLSKKAMIKLDAHRKAVEETVILFDKHPKSENMHKTTEGKHVRRTALHLQTQLRHDYFHLHEIEDFEKSFAEGTIYNPDFPSESPQ